MNPADQTNQAKGASQVREALESVNAFKQKRIELKEKLTEIQNVSALQEFGNSREFVNLKFKIKFRKF